jgi:hypothetical protein
VSDDLFKTLLIVGGFAYIVLMVVGGTYVASVKGRPLEEGAAFAILLGPFGMLIVACLPTIEPAKAEEAYLHSTEPMARHQNEVARAKAILDAPYRPPSRA